MAYAGPRTTMQRGRIGGLGTHRSLVVDPNLPSCSCASFPERTSYRQRQSKNPKQFPSMDVARDHLQQERTQLPSLSSLLNWLSENTFGSSSQSPLGKVLRWLTQNAATQRRRRRGRTPEDVPVTPELLARATASRLSPVLVVSPHTVAKMATRCSDVLSMTPSELADRLLQLKEALPGCDVVILVERCPGLYLRGTQADIMTKVKASSAVLLSQLKGADVWAMIEHDPALLFLDVASGTTRLRELWPPADVDEQALGNSDPSELALAVRALADEPPDELPEFF